MKSLTPDNDTHIFYFINDGTNTILQYTTTMTSIDSREKKRSDNKNVSFRME